MTLPCTSRSSLVRSSVLSVLVLAGACAAPTVRPSSAAPSSSAMAVTDEPSLVARAESAYAEKRYPECARFFEQARATAQSESKQRSFAYNAACCHALGGNVDAAFAMLGRAQEAGLRDLLGAEQDPDLGAVRADPRWPAFVAASEARNAAWEQSLGAPELRRELLALVAEDQAVRSAWIAQPSEQTSAAMSAIDRKSTMRMKEVVARHGWPGASLIGEDGANAAWLLVQHADLDVAFQKQCLALMEPLVERGEVTGAEFAYLYDRVAVAEKRPQRFGTQFDETREPRPIEDPAHVNERRAKVGLGTMAEYRQQMLRVYGPPPTTPAQR